MRAHIQWRWHLDEDFVRINSETYYLWRAVDHEGEALESCVTVKRDHKAALGFLRRAMKRYGRPDTGKPNNQVVGWLRRKLCFLDDGPGI